jgi:hypothetical protein
MKNSSRNFKWGLGLILILFLAACRSDVAVVPPTSTPVPVATATAVLPTTTPTSEPIDAPADSVSVAEEAILILEPGLGSRVTSPIRVAGTADSTFEQNLVVRLVADDGTELALFATTIDADLGQRGPFAVDLPFTVSGERQAFIQVYASSGRDGGVTHLAAVGVTLADSGPAAIRPVTDSVERITISQPATGDTIQGGSVLVTGIGLASFEQTLLVELLDAEGNVLAMQPIIVAAPDLGQQGPFEATLTYQIASSQPGRIVVRDVSPAFGGDVHLASVEVKLEP